MLCLSNYVIVPDLETLKTLNTQENENRSFGFIEILHMTALYSKTSMARTRIARLLWIIRTHFRVLRKFFQYLKKTNILGYFKDFFLIFS